MKGIKIFTEESNKITLSSIDDNRMQSIDSVEKYAYGTSKDLVSGKEDIKCNKYNKIIQKKIKQGNIKVHNPNWSWTPDHP